MRPPSKPDNITYLHPARPPARRPLPSAVEALIHLSAGALVGAAAAFTIYVVYLVLQFIIKGFGFVPLLIGLMLAGGAYALVIRGDR